MSEAAPFFSVVTPSWNQAQFIEGCIRSVLEQGVEDFEHIVLDNCSTDGTQEILARYPHLKWRSEPDTGQSQALNRGFAEARGEVICWLNADDAYLPGTFETVRREFAEHGRDVIYGDAEEVYFDGRPAGVRQARFEKRRDILIWWEKRVDLLQPAVFFRREVLGCVGPLREDLHLIMDTELWWRISEHYDFHYVARPLALQQRQPDSKTIKHAHRIYEEKAWIFDPILAALEPGKQREHARARRVGLGRRYLGLAQSAGKADRTLGLELLSRSRAENPWVVLQPAWWRALLFLRRIG
ncbi:MAG: glycosyltransferase family 2 protein [Chthoniobacteraceae bacterium]